MSNRDVIRSWQAGQVKASAHLTTDGATLYSYAMPIGVTRPDGRKIAVVGAPGSNSMTTAHHMSAAAGAADAVVRVAGHSWCSAGCDHVRAAVQS